MMTRSFGVRLPRQAGAGRTGYDAETSKGKTLEPSFGMRLEDRLRTQRTQRRIKTA